MKNLIAGLFIALAALMSFAGPASADSKQNDYRGSVSQGETRSAAPGVVLGGGPSKAAPIVMLDGNKFGPKVGNPGVLCGTKADAGYGPASPCAHNKDALTGFVSGDK